MISTPHRVNDRFELVERLGSGNFSDVYLARDDDPGDGPTEVAFKLFRTIDRGPAQERALSSLEFRMLSRLRHPNLARVYDYGVDTETSRSYFTMELLRGVDFLEAVPGLEPLDLLPLAVGTCRALHHIHTRGLIHHDLKSGNLIVSAAGRIYGTLDETAIKLTDFGLSTSFEDADDGYLRGTPEYMAPEMLAGRSKDHRCDLYSLGVLLYVGLSGQFPFPDGRRPGTESDTAPQLRRRNGEPVPAFLEDLVGRLLEADPNDRYQTANDVIRDLRLHTGTPWPLEPGSVGASSAVSDTVLTISPMALDGLRDRLARVGAGMEERCRPAVIIGRPGAGKTHLVMELRRIAQTSGAGFFIAPAPDQGTTADKAGRLMDRIDRTRRFSGSGVAVVLDLDEQGADVTMEVLRLLTRGPAGEYTCLLITANPDEPATGQLLAAAAGEDAPEEIPLRPLDSDGLANLLSQLLGSQVAPDDQLVDCVLEESDGIPLLAEETVSRLRASGALRLTLSGAEFDARQHRYDFSEPTGHLRDHHRRRSSGAVDEPFVALAVIGAPATAAMVAGLIDMPEADVEAVLSRETGSLLSAIRSRSGTYYHFASILTRNMVRGTVPPKRLPESHRQAAAALEQAGAIPDLDPETLIWRHLLLAGDRAGAWRRGLDHGRRLESELRFEEAGQVFESLINHGPPTDVPVDCVVELLWSSAVLHRTAGRTDDARTNLEQAEEYAAEAGLTLLLARVRLDQGYLLEKQGDLEQAAELYRRELEGPAAGDTAMRTEALFRLGINAVWRERPEEAEQCLEALLRAGKEAGEEGPDPTGLFLQSSIIKSRQRPDEAIELLERWLSTPEGQTADTVMAGRLNVQLGDLLYHQNRFAEADRLFARAMEIFTAHGEQSLAAITLANRGAMHFEQGRFSVAGRYNLDCLRAHERMGNRYGQARSQYNLGVCDFHRGRYTEAMEHLRASRGIHEYVGDVQGLAQSLNMEAELFLTLDIPDEADRRLREAEDVLPPGDTGYSAADRLLLEAERLLRTGSEEEAAQSCGRARELFTALGDARQEARTAMLLARCLAIRERAAASSAALDRARTLTVNIDAPRLHAELLLAASDLRCRSGLGPSHEACAERCRTLLDELAELEDPDFLQSLWGALGRHLLALGLTEEAMAAWSRAFELLRGVAGRFDSAHTSWKSAYLSAPHRSDVVRSLAEWSKKNPPRDSSRHEK